MSDQISERMLERARLGELDESELAELVSRLEREEGGTHRLDALIEADAEFLEQHPADQMVPLIREQLRRRAREEARKSQRKGSTMLSVRQIFSEHRAQAGVLVLLLIAAIAAGAFSFYGERESPTVPVPDARLTEVGADRVPSGEETPEPITQEGFIEFVDRLDRRLTDSNELILEPGKEVTFDAHGVRRIAIDRNDVAEARVDEESRAVTLRAKNAGLTGVRVFFTDHNPAVMYVRVADRYSPEEMFPGKIVARAPAGVIEACHGAALKSGNGAGEIVIRVLTSPGGDVSSAHAEFSSLEKEFEECLIGSAYEHEFPKIDGDEHRTALLELEFDDEPRRP